MWQHGYVVSVISYNANARQGRRAESLDVPPIRSSELTELASSEVWFD